MLDHQLTIRHIIAITIRLTTFLVCIISLSRLIFDFANIATSEMMLNLFAVYRSVFHPPATYLMNNIFKFDLGPIGIDIAILYLAVGFATRFTFERMMTMNNKVIDGNAFKSLQIRGVNLSVIGAFFAAFWPVALVGIFQHPKIVLRYAGTDHAYLQPTDSTRLSEMLSAEKAGDTHMYVGDTRFWTLFAFLAVGAGVIAFVIMNYVYLSSASEH